MLTLISCAQEGRIAFRKIHAILEGPVKVPFWNQGLKTILDIYISISIYIDIYVYVVLHVFLYLVLLGPLNSILPL